MVEVRRDGCSLLVRLMETVGLVREGGIVDIVDAGE